jgi:hypothetical protein
MLPPLGSSPLPDPQLPTINSAGKQERKYPMLPLIQLKKITSLFVIVLLLVCFAIPQVAQAVSPAPDGGYPNFNTAEGQNALFSLTTGQWNTALGAFTLGKNTEGSDNTAVGTAALLSNIGNQISGLGRANTAVGAAALLLNSRGSSNTAIGEDALENNTIGGGNVAVGESALLNNTIGSGNTALGDGAGGNVTTANNVICIGSSVIGNNVDNSCYIGHIFNATSSGGTAVYVNTNGRLGTATSSKRFKEGIKPMDDASKKLFSLKPVTFRYKKGIDPESPKHKSEFGLVAEDVEKVNPDLVARDKQGKPYSVRYDQVNAMLLNEFLKEHRKVEQMQKQIEALTAGLQKVSAQLEAGRPAPRVAENNQ